MNENTANTPLDYCNDTIYCNWTSDENNNYILSSNMIIENLGNTINDINMDQLLSIKQELLDSIDDTFKEDIEKDEEIIKEKEYIDTNISLFEDFIQKIKKQQDKLIDMEVIYKKSIQNTQEDLEKINTFHNFLKDIINNYSDDDDEIKQIKDDILKISNKIKNNNNTLKIRKEYQRELHLFNEYTRLLKKLNNGNIGNTCSLCLQKSVSRYFNPCGHTACEDCIKKLYEKNGDEYNINCFICRKRINSNHPIYFI